MLIDPWIDANPNATHTEPTYYYYSYYYCCACYIFLSSEWEAHKTGGHFNRRFQCNNNVLSFMKKCRPTKVLYPHTYKFESLALKSVWGIKQ